MILLDTNIILRFILGDDPLLSPKAKIIFEKIDQEETKVFISLLTIFETIFTLEGSYRLSKSEIVAKIATIIRKPNVVIERPQILSESFPHYLKKNIDFADAYHIALMRKKKIKEIYSFDRDFDKFPQNKRLEN